jgi:N6-adenosine-specific RNA methylase IME4
VSEQTADILDLDLARLLHLDQGIDADESGALLKRWEFGQALLAKREGKQLPRGLMTKLCEQTGKSRQELNYRMQFAERYPTEAEVANAVGNFRSWHQVVARGLTAPASAPDIQVAPEAVEALPLPEGVYRVVVADPPWQYSNKATRGAAEDHYQTLTIPQLVGAEDLPDGVNLAEEVQARTADAAHLYLWTTNGFLREAFDVLDAWGFQYKTCLTWVKPQMGMGNYFRSSTEHVLFGVKGNLGTNSRSLMNWFQAARTKHSAKPESFYDLVEKASPPPYLELFARRRRLGAWSVWGDQA